MAIMSSAGRAPRWLRVKRERLDPVELLQSVDEFDFPVDVYAVLTAIGIDCEVAEIDEAEARSGLLEYDGKWTAAVLINADESFNRQRYTAAFLLGYLLLHGEEGRPRRYLRPKRSTTNEKAAEANAYAASLLMPFPLLRQATRLYGEDYESLASLFYVSKTAMLHQLGRMRDWRLGRIVY